MTDRRQCHSDCIAVRTLVLVGSLTAFGPLCVDMGPISDALGRRKPLFVGLAVFVASSLACAFAPTIEVLIALRLLQRLGGAAGIGPLVAPQIGAALLHLGSWRTLFLGLGVVGVILLIAAALGLAETLPPSARQPLHRGSMATLVRKILRNRRFTAVTVAG